MATLEHDPDTLFQSVLVPVASEEVARTVPEAFLPHLESSGGVATVVHVIEDTEGGLDPLPLSIQEERAQRSFEPFSAVSLVYRK